MSFDFGRSAKQIDPFSPEYRPSRGSVFRIRKINDGVPGSYQLDDFQKRYREAATRFGLVEAHEVDGFYLLVSYACNNNQAVSSVFGVVPANDPKTTDRRLYEKIRTDACRLVDEFNGVLEDETNFVDQPAPTV